MGYFLIAGRPVFLSHRAWAVLRDRALKGKDASFRVSSTVAGRRENAQAHRLMSRELESLARDREAFVRDWLNFDLSGEEAAENVWDLLYDYCCFRGAGRLVDLRSDATRVLADLREPGGSWLFPMGRVFALEFPIAEQRLFWPRIRGTFRLVVNAGEVRRLVGTLEKFTVHMAGTVLHCAKQMTLLQSPGELQSAEQLGDSNAS